MRNLLVLVFSCAMCCSLSAEQFATNVDDGMTVDANDWPWWRGPQRNGTAFPAQRPPTQWSEKENVVWKAKVPGRGHGAPTVVGNRVYIATADRERDLQSVLCYDRASGTLRWEAVVHRGGIMKKNKKASQASSTVAWDGERVLISFLNGGAIFTTALSPTGKQLWQSRIQDYVIHQGYGRRR